MSGGSPGTTQVHSTPGTQDPGSGAAGSFFNSLFGGNLPPFPFQYPGSLDPGLSPTLQNAIRMSQGYSQAGPPEVLQGVQGALGRFMTPSFQNPMVRGGMGYPAYFGGLANRVFGGQSANQLGISGPVDATGGGPKYGSWGGAGGGGGWGGHGYRTPPWWQGPDEMDLQQPGQEQQGQPSAMTAGAGTGTTPTLPPVDPMSPAVTTDKGLLDWMQSQQISPTYDASGMPVFSSRMPGAKTAWSAGAGANKGETRRNSQTGQIEIYRATGAGGEGFGWTPYDPNNSGHVLDATMFQRYGQNWTSGGGAGGAGGHSTDVTAELEAQLGRKPTMFEVQDAMYGVKPGGFQYSSVPAPTPAATPPATPAAATTPPTGGTMTPIAKPPGAGTTGTVGGGTGAGAGAGTGAGGTTATGAAPSYGGYTTAQLQNQSRLLRLLGPHALQRWMQAHPNATRPTGAAAPRPRGGIGGVGAGGMGAGAQKPIMPPPPPSQIKAFG